MAGQYTMKLMQQTHHRTSRRGYMLTAHSNIRGDTLTTIYTVTYSDNIKMSFK